MVHYRKSIVGLMVLNKRNKINKHLIKIRQVFKQKMILCSCHGNQGLAITFLGCKFCFLFCISGLHLLLQPFGQSPFIRNDKCFVLSRKFFSNFIYLFAGFVKGNKNTTTRTAELRIGYSSTNNKLHMHYCF